MVPLSYRTSVTSHGGIIVGGAPHNIKVSVGGGLREASLDRDIHVCPICCHGVNIVIADAFVNFHGIPHTRIGNICTCGAVVVGSSDNTLSD